jgi:hypothetical protein
MDHQAIFRCEGDFWAALRREAAADRRTVSGWLRIIVGEELARRGHSVVAQPPHGSLKTEANELAEAAAA